MQVRSVTENPSMPTVIKTIVKRDGYVGLYSGITAAWLRQLTYGSTRLGVYSYVLALANKDRNGSPIPFSQKLGIGMIAGSLGALVGTPAELALVRMGADSRLPVAEQRNYKHAVDCVMRVAKEEGVRTLWRGAVPTVGRAAAMNSCLLGVTSETKERLAASYGMDPKAASTVFLSAFNASFFANAAAMPFDVVKSRIQTMTTTGPQYTGMLDCASKSVKEEGFLVLWRGFTPAFVKLAPYSVISMLVLDKVTNVYSGGTAEAT